MKIVNISFISLPREVVHFMDKETQNIYILSNDCQLRRLCECVDMIDKGGYLLLLSDKPLDINSDQNLTSIEEKFPDLMFIRVGEFDGVALEESWAYTLKTANNENTNKEWNTLIRRYKKRFKVGGSIVGHMGVKKYSKNIRIDKHLLEESTLSFFPMYTRKFTYVFT